MLVTCHECQAKYSVADEKVRGRTARVRCRRCSTLIEVSGVPSHTPAVSYDDPTTVPQPQSMRRAAVLPREGDRARRDLFAPPPEPAPSAPATTPPLGMGGVAARNENSVLFSLSALGGSVRPVAAPAVSNDKPREDSGLIDLNALMAAPLTPKSVPPIMASEAPVGAFTREVSDPDVVVSSPRAAKKRTLFVGLGVAAALLAVVGLQFIARSADRDAAASVPPPVTAPAAAPAAAPPAPVTPVVAAAPANDAKPIVASTSDERPHGKGKHKSSAHRSSSHAASASAPAAPAAAPDPCHCHGNLMCAMKCSAH